MALTVQKFFYFLAKNNPEFYTKNEVIEKLYSGTEVIGEVALRYFDILVESLNRSPALFSHYKDLVEKKW